MKPTLTSVQKLLSDIKNMIKRVQEKDEKLKTREISTFFYQSAHNLKQCTPAYLNHPEALDALLAAAPAFEAYRGKGTQTINDAYPEILQCILMESSRGLFSSSDPSTYTEETTRTALQKIFPFALERAKGNGKPIRSKRVVNMRHSYWQLLEDISEQYAIPEAVDLAKKVASDETASIPERQGAISLLLNHLSYEPDDVAFSAASLKEITAIIDKIRNNPPNREILFQILDAGVNSGSINEMTALCELEDWDDYQQD